MKNALKEIDDLKLKLEKFETSSHNLTKLINCQLSVNYKTGLGYDSQMNKSNLNDVHVNESQMIRNSLIDSHESDEEDNQVNDRDGENLDKIKVKGDECIFVGCSTQSRAYRVYNKRTRVIIESIHVNFDELPQMASVHNSSDPAPTVSLWRQSKTVLTQHLHVKEWHQFKSVLIPHLNVKQWHLNTAV
nr:retrovirus-related Pol polyprotein from transposon TNT 1-94 [Tanacetum cinerariifolium]